MGEMLDWLEISASQKGKLDTSVLDPSEKIGWLKHAFVLAFMYLKDNNISYQHAIRETIALAGDTDTNAAIVGGMIGALLGRKGIKNDYIEKVLTCDISKGKHGDRPMELDPAKSFLKLFDVMMGKCPSQIVVETGAPAKK